MVYEDFAAGRRATDTRNLLMSKLGDEFELRCSMWKFEILRSAKLREMAAVEATEADAIIIAAHGTSPLPDEVTSWVDAWIPLRGDHPAALIVLLDRAFHRGDLPPAAYDYLRSVATAAKMDFLPEITAFTRNEPAASSFALQSEASAAPSGVFPRWTVSERHWGINE